MAHILPLHRSWKNGTIAKVMAVEGLCMNDSNSCQRLPVTLSPPNRDSHPITPSRDRTIRLFPKSRIC